MADGNGENVDGDVFEEFVRRRMGESPRIPSQQPVVDVNALINSMNCLMQQNATMLQMLQQSTNSQSQVNVSSTNNNRSYHVIPDFSQSISTFNAENLLKSKEWLESIESTAALHNWPSEYKLETARTHLLGAAKAWYQSRQNIIHNWDDFRQQFRNTFVHEENLTHLWKTMTTRVQRAKEDISAYFHDKVRLCKSLNLSFDEQKEQVAIGLASRELASMIMTKNHIDLDDVYRDLISFERLNNERRQRYNVGERPKPVSASGVSYVPGKSVPRNDQTKPKCYNCNQEGHYASSCSKPKREKGSCFTCGKMGHKFTNCPEKAHRSTHVVQKGNPYVVSFDYSLTKDDNCVCKYSLEALIDSGSPISLMKEKYVPFYDKNVNDNYDFTGINGTKVDVLGIFQTDIMINDITIYVKFYVVTDTTMSYASILGRDFLATPDLKITLSDSIKIEKIIQSNSTDKISDGDANFINEIMHLDYLDENELEVEELDINQLTSYKNQQELKMLYESEYKTKINTDIVENEFKMHISLKNSQPITFRPRRLSFQEKEKLRDILDELLDQRIIRESSSPYASPIVMIQKKNANEYRLCVDYRALNDITIKDNYPTPLIDDHLDMLKDKHYYSTLDLKNGFHHIKMAEDSIQYTSFVTPLGQFEYLRLPFGLTNGPRVFQRFLNRIFSSLIRENKILLYLDDILVATNNISEHLDILKQIFILARQNSLHFRLDKCKFLYNQCIYLGYLVDKDGIRPNPENMKALLSYPIPKNTKEAHRFIGLASYFRRFIQNFSLIAKPLYNLIKKNVEFKFESDELESFEKLKTCLASFPVLAVYSPKLDTQLHCDASACGYGAILLQKQLTGKFNPVFYYSKRTTPTEAKYHSFELECLAVVYAIKRFHIYLFGIPFKIVTDCDSFRLTLSKSNINPRISRWAMLLQNYQYEIEHRSNKGMSHVDALSRITGVMIIEENSFEDNLSIAQNLDPFILDVKNKLVNEESKDFELHNGLVYKKLKYSKKKLFYVPCSMENKVIANCHDNLGHLGFDKTCEYLSRVYWFPNYRSKIKTYIQNCIKCITYSSMLGKGQGQLHNIPKGDKPFNTIHVDHYGPLEKTPSGKRYVFELIDAFTKFVKLYSVKSTKTIEVIHKLEDYFNYYSRPIRVISDRGSSFISTEFSEFLKKNNIVHIKIATHSPKSNGQIERTNRDLTPMLAKLSELKNKWDKQLPIVEFAINNSYCRSIAMSPAELLFGIHQKDPNDNLRTYVENENEEVRDLIDLRQKAKIHNEQVQNYNKEYFDKRHRPPHKYCIGDYVMIKNLDVTPGVNKKLLPKFRGPYEVKKVLDNDRYLVIDVENFQVTQRPFEGICCPENMRMWLKSD